MKADNERRLPAVLSPTGTTVMVHITAVLEHLTPVGKKLG